MLILVGSFLTILLAAPRDAAFAGGDGGDVDRPAGVTATADSPSNDGVARDAGSGADTHPSCSAWERSNAGSGPTDVHRITVKQDGNGDIWFEYARVCDGQRSYTWFRQQTSKDAADQAHDEVTKLIPHLQPQLAPPLAKSGVVNVNTWIGLDQPAPVSVTATVPSLSATVTATAYKIAWTPGDGSTVDCGNLGVVWHPGMAKSWNDAPCGWTPKYPSLPKFTHTDDLTYRGEFHVAWRINWTGSDGRAGTYPDLTVDTPTAYRVSEIQTIGDG